MDLEPERSNRGGVEQEYLTALAAGTFQIQRCVDCGKSVFYPRCVCPHCGSSKLDWFLPSGRGIVHAKTTVRRKPDQGGDYNICLVDLEEGVRMMAQVASVPPVKVRIGMRVQAHVEQAPGQPRVVFEPMESQA